MYFFPKGGVMSNIKKRGYVQVEPGSERGPSVTELLNGTIIYNTPYNHALHGETVPTEETNRIYWFDDEEIKIFGYN